MHGAEVDTAHPIRLEAGEVQARDAPKPQMQAQDVLITRPDFDPAPHLLPPGGGAWFAALAAGATLDQAHDTALATHPDFDLGAALGLCFATGAFCAKNGG